MGINKISANNDTDNRKYKNNYKKKYLFHIPAMSNQFIVFPFQ